jgi:hypothetical protein
MLGFLFAGSLFLQAVVALISAIRPVLMNLSCWIEALSVHAGQPERRAVTTVQSDLLGSNCPGVGGHLVDGTLSLDRSGWRSRLPLRETLYDGHVLTTFAGNGPLPFRDSGETVRFPFGRDS